MEYTYSYQNAKDQIFDVPVAGSMGYQYLRTNAGRMTVKTHELSLNASLIQTKDWDLDLGLNYTKIKNDVKELAPGVESIMLGGFVEPQVRAMAGHTYPKLVAAMPASRTSSMAATLPSGQPSDMPSRPAICCILPVATMP